MDYVSVGKFDVFGTSNFPVPTTSPTLSCPFAVRTSLPCVNHVGIRWRANRQRVAKAWREEEEDAQALATWIYPFNAPAVVPAR